MRAGALSRLAFVCRNKDFELANSINVLEENDALKTKEHTFYNYILLKKSALGNLRRLGTQLIDSNLDIFPIFILFLSCILYIGKATGRRDLDHIREAILAIMYGNGKPAEVGDKLYTCMLALLEGEGIVIVTGFHDSSTYMANSREAAMLDWFEAEAPGRLTNIRLGSYYGDALGWSQTKKNNYGIMILYCLFRNYLNDGSNGLKINSLCCKPKAPKHEDTDEEMEEECGHNNLCCINCNKTIKKYKTCFIDGVLGY